MSPQGTPDGGYWGAMLRFLILRKLAKEEKKLGASMDYVRHIVRVSLRAFFKFIKVLPLSEYRRKLPADAHYVARLVAARDEDCGSCMQIEVNLAKRDGVAVSILRSVVDQKPEDLPDDLNNVYRFAKGVVEANGEEDVLREDIERQYGEEGLVEMSLAMAACRVFPIVKRGLGYAKSCELVELKL